MAAFVPELSGACQRAWRWCGVGGTVDYVDYVSVSPVEMHLMDCGVRRPHRFPLRQSIAIPMRRSARVQDVTNAPVWDTV